jgi:hypothetical protein
MNGKIPTVQRDMISGGLTGESAYKWALFIADEYSFDSDDPLLYDVFKSMAESLEPKPGKATVSSFHSNQLEKEILKWTQSTD